tara:strand:- start:2832 stop:3524 length:693 start_codon:yes stop_codon:yes gene_type:complete
MKTLNCLITGASSGIGREISIELSKYAKHIYINSRTIDKLEEVHDQIIHNDCECTIVPLNLNDPNGIENLASQVFLKDKSLDILILSAGTISQLSPVDSMELTKLNEVLNLNYLSNFRMIKSFHPLLKNSKNSNIIAISSIMDKTKEHYWGIYQPIMSALNELLLIYANENKNTNIKTNIFCPKSVNTKFRESIMPGEDKKNLITPRDVAIKVVDFVLKTKSNGQIIEIN